MIFTSPHLPIYQHLKWGIPQYSTPLPLENLEKILRSCKKTQEKINFILQLNRGLLQQLNEK